MVWEHVLFPKPSIYPFNFEALKALGSLSSSFGYLIGDTQKFYSTKNQSFHLFEGKRKVGFGLTPHVVHSTLVNCSSDLVALSFFMWCARQPNYFHDRFAFRHMGSVAGRLAQRFESVNEIVRQLESIGCATKAQSFLLLLRMFWQGGLYSLVFDVYEEMIKLGYTPNSFVYNVIIDVSFKIDRKDAALRILREISIPNFLSYNIAVCNLCKLNDLENIKGVLEIMLRSGYYPNAETFVKVMNCFCKKGSLVQAFQILGLMICLGLQVSVAVWSILIDGLCRKGRPVAAVNMLEKMIGVGCSPNVVTYTSLLKALMDYGMVDDAFRILTLMENSGCKPDLVLSNLLMHRLSKVGRYDEAISIFIGLRKIDMKPDSFTFSCLFSAVQMSGKFFLLPKLVKGFVIPADLVVCNALLSYLCKAGFPTRAVAFYHEMVDRGYIPDKYSYTELLGGLCRARKIDEAVNVYQAMIRSDFILDAHVHTVLINGLIKVGKYHQAMRLVEQVVAEKCPLDVVLYAVAIEGLVRGGRVGEALTLYNKMKEVGFSPSPRTYNLMLSGLCEVTDVNMVKEILEEMHDEGVELDYKTCIKISSFVSKSSYYHSIVHLLTKMWDSGLLADSVMPSLLQEGHSPGAISGNGCSLVKRCMGDSSSTYTSRSNRYSFVETSSSDDLPDMVASVG